MSEHKSHKVKLENIPKGKIICHLSNRSDNIKLLLWASTGVLLLVKRPILAILVGFYAVVYTFSTEKKLFDGYEKFFVIYNDQTGECCELIYISEIEGWEYRIMNSGDKIIFYLPNNEKYRVDTNVDRKIYNYLKQVLPEKEIRKKKES